MVADHVYVCDGMWLYVALIYQWYCQLCDCDLYYRGPWRLRMSFDSLIPKTTAINVAVCRSNCALHRTLKSHRALSIFWAIPCAIRSVIIHFVTNLQSDRILMSKPRAVWICTNVRGRLAVMIQTLLHLPWSMNLRWIAAVDGRMRIHISIRMCRQMTIRVTDTVGTTGSMTESVKMDAGTFTAKETTTQLTYRFSIRVLTRWIYNLLFDVSVL